MRPSQPFFRILTVVAIVLLLASCVTSKQVNLMQDPARDKRIPAYTDTLSYIDYELRSGDRLFVRVHSVDENVQRLFNAAISSSNNNNFYGNYNNFNANSYGTGSITELYTYQVLDDGTMDFPLVGRLHVRGLNTRQVKALLEQELGTYIKDYGDFKMVSVDVNIVQRTYSVISQRGAGTYSIRREKLTIFEALAQAGDVGDWSDRSKVKVVREKEGKTEVISFDLRSKDIINSEFYYVEPNDVIYVQQLRGKAFGVSNIATSVAVVATTLSFGGFVYALVQRIITASKGTK